jgi:hypothetical protein
MPWPKGANIDALQLKRENDGLRTTILCLRRELTDKQGHVQRLEVLLCSRPHKIDELYAKLEQARAQNRKLEAEAAIFAAIRRAYAGCTQGAALQTAKPLALGPAALHSSPKLVPCHPREHTAFGVGVELVLGTLTDSSTKESIAPVRWFGVAKK